MRVACRCGAQFCYHCGRRWRTCSCPQFDVDPRNGLRPNVVFDGADQQDPVTRELMERQRANPAERGPTAAAPNRGATGWADAVVTMALPPGRLPPELYLPGAIPVPLWRTQAGRAWTELMRENPHNRCRRACCAPRRHVSSYRHGRYAHGSGHGRCHSCRRHSRSISPVDSCTHETFEHRRGRRTCEFCGRRTRHRYWKCEDCGARACTDCTDWVDTVSEWRCWPKNGEGVE